MNIQAPPNLNSDACQTYILAGINDWGGVSPVTRDHINPEAPWPAIEHLRHLTEECGYHLGQRLAIYPEFLHGDLSGFAPPLRKALAVKMAEVGYNGEAGRDEIRFKAPVELVVNFNMAAPTNKAYNTDGSMRYLEHGNIVFGVYQAHLNDHPDSYLPVQYNHHHLR